MTKHSRVWRIFILNIHQLGTPSLKKALWLLTMMLLGNEPSLVQLQQEKSCKTDADGYDRHDIKQGDTMLDVARID